VRILWHSNAPHAPTGYGNQTDLFVPRLAKQGHEIVVSAFYGLQGAPMRSNGVLVLPNGRDSYGNDTLVADAEFFNSDIVITLMDVWVLEPGVTGMVRWCPWLPVDHDPVPPGVADKLRTAYQPIAYSKFGEDALKSVGYKPQYVPHGVDTEVFKPVDQKEAREVMGCPDDVFLVGMVAANKGYPSRKAFDQHIRAFAEFHKRHEDSMLYLHTDWTGRMGEHIEYIVEMAGIHPSKVAQPPLYKYQRGMLDNEYMRHVYASMDVLMNATRGEGFGIPIVEAQACGTPVIVGSWTAMPELVTEDTGWTVGYSDKFFSQESYQFVPSVDDIVDKLEAAYKERGQRSEVCRAHAVSTYDADMVTETYWKPVLAQIEARIKADTERQKPVVVEARHAA